MIKGPINEVTLRRRPSVNGRARSDSPLGKILVSLFPPYQTLTHSQYASWKQLSAKGVHMSTLSQSLSKQGNNEKHICQWHPEFVPFPSTTSSSMCSRWTPPAPHKASHPMSKVWGLECWQCRNSTRVNDNKQLFQKQPVLFRQLNLIFHSSPGKGRVTDLPPRAPCASSAATNIQSSLKVFARVSSKLPREGCSSPLSALNSPWKRENIFVSCPLSQLPRLLLPTGPTPAHFKYTQNPALQKEQGLWFHRDWDANMTQAKQNWASQHFMVRALSAGRRGGEHQLIPTGNPDRHLSLQSMKQW